MIKCNRCGNMTATGAGYCQSCGTPLLNKIDNSTSPKMGGQDQAELPAWLESLRAGERSAPPVNNPSNFSAADFVEEGSLPSWMRSERNESRENSSLNSPLPVRPVPPPAPSPEEGLPPSNGFIASSLIDEQSLPAWMQEGKLASSSASWSASGAQEGLQSPPPSSQGGVSASSLVQPDNLPAWMKTLQQQQPSAQPVRNEAVRPTESPSAPAHGFSAHDLIDQQSLPSWMASQTAQGQSPASNNIPGTPSHNTPVAPVNNNANLQSGFSASSLLDVNSLPQWLREGGQAPRTNAPAPTPVWTPPAQPEQLWPAQGQAQPAQQQQAEGMSASSFIDQNALPSWLRTAGEPGSMAGGAPDLSAQRPGAYSMPPRVDNMRVPSRPRSEINPNESSEVAANVFASMLGVASATPNYPPAPANPQYGGQSGQSGAPPHAGMSGGGPVPSTPSGMPGQPPQEYRPGSGVYGGYAANPNQGYAGNPGNNYPGSGNTGGFSLNPNSAYPANPGINQAYQMNTPMGSPQMPINNTRTPFNAGGAPTTNNDQKNSAKPGKRRFLDAVREWFER